MYCPKIDTKEAIASEVQEIVDCIKQDKIPTVDGQAGLMVVKILEASQNSIKKRGKEVKI
jgi:predicted dehydrogenase